MLIRDFRYFFYPETSNLGLEEIDMILYVLTVSCRMKKADFVSLAYQHICKFCKASTRHVAADTSSCRGGLAGNARKRMTPAMAGERRRSVGLSKEEMDEQVEKSKDHTVV